MQDEYSACCPLCMADLHIAKKNIKEALETEFRCYSIFCFAFFRGRKEMRTDGSSGK